MEEQKKFILGMWTKTNIFGSLVFLIGIGYMFLYRGTIDLIVLSENLAFTGGILIGLSFALSGITFFYNFLDSKLKYRKHLGLLGYYFAVAYTVTLLLRFPDRYWFQLPSSLLTAEVQLGVTAIAILTFMAIISQNWAAKQLGRHWRPLLRLGYIAYLLLIIRAVIVEGAGWLLWAESFETVPPPRLILTVYAVFVILLRIILEIALQRKKKLPVSSPVATTPQVLPAPTTDVPVAVGAVNSHTLPTTSKENQRTVS